MIKMINITPEMKRPLKIMLISLGILFGGIIAYKTFMNIMMKRFFASNRSPVITVSTMKAGYTDWQPKIKASGTTRAIKGVNVTTELAGMVETIYFTPGSEVKQGEILVQLKASGDRAKLRGLEANAELARITHERDKQQYKIHAVSKQQLDTDEQNLKNLQAQVAEQASTVNKKSIRAPFDGRVGICKVNPGQYLTPGDTVTMLQTLDPIYIDFYVPQQTIPQLAAGQTVTVTTETFPGKVFNGKVTTINPGVDPGTRNVEVEATIENPAHELHPGMFALVEVNAGTPKQFLTLPQSAITFNPYGDIVYLVKENGKDDHNKPNLIVRQSFVVTGETRGDQITILDGLKDGDIVVTSGQLKLRNGSRVAINNRIQPSDNPHPVVTNEHEE